MRLHSPNLLITFILAHITFCGSLTSYSIGWDAHTGKELQRPEHTGIIKFLSYATDGTRLVTSEDGIVRIWMLDSNDLICDACSRLGCDLISREWQAQYCRECEADS